MLALQTPDPVWQPAHLANPGGRKHHMEVDGRSGKEGILRPPGHRKEENLPGHFQQ